MRDNNAHYKPYPDVQTDSILDFSKQLKSAHCDLLRSSDVSYYLRMPIVQKGLLVNVVQNSKALISLNGIEWQLELVACP